MMKVWNVMTTCLAAALAAASSGQTTTSATTPPVAVPAPVVEKTADGALITFAGSPSRRGGTLKLQVKADGIIRIAFAKDLAFFERESFVVLPIKSKLAPPRVSSDESRVTVTTPKLKAVVELFSGAVSFFDAATDRPILQEQPDGRTLEETFVQGDRTNHIRQIWQPNSDESLYGLGQHQLGLFDIKGYDLDLWQHNGTVVVPMLVSSRGYGILWDNLSYSRFGDLRHPSSIPADQLFDADGKPGGLTASYFADGEFKNRVARRTDSLIEVQPPPQQQQQQQNELQAGGWQGSGQWQGGASAQGNARIDPSLPPRGDIAVRWEGFVQPKRSGEHLFQTYSNSGIKLWVDDRLVIDHWRQGWLPWCDVARVALEADKRYKIKLEWTKDQGDKVRLTWKPPAENAPSLSQTPTALWSEVGEGSDYYLIYGPRLDDVVAGYRRLTGPAPLAPQWAFGLWQSRQRYETAQQVLDVIDGFRSRKIPFDNIVMDWFYWKQDAWGSHEFDPARFPDPAGWIKAIHDRGARLMISVWPKFYPGTKNFEEMRSKGYLYERVLADETRDWVRYPYTFYDAFNAGASKLFWKQIERELFSKHVDAWWLDATEPDLTRQPTLQGQRVTMHPTALGPGSKVLNGFALVNSAAVYEGQRAAAPDQRVFILTRSGFAGQQRYAAATWSGDISSTWQALAKQVPAGISFCLSGIPYWTQDIGGFSVPPWFSRRDGMTPEHLDEWRELNARWFEFGTFTPLLRVHGEFPHREMWEFGGEDSPAYRAMLKFDRLRYRLLPYVYSIAANATHENGTMMRALVMDFPDDDKAREIADQYMFGPALLVNPVTSYKARSRNVYLPGGSAWFDFWTGKHFDGPQVLSADAPYDAIPLFVRAGSILPLGPEIQRTSEKPADPVSLLVYGGSDASFTLYEDDGLTYGYERGESSRIRILWDDAHRKLTLGAREGSFPGMLKDRKFIVRVIEKDRPFGFDFDELQNGKMIDYDGAEQRVQFN